MDPERYQILGVCGEGSRCTVYKALAKTVNSLVAVKKLRTDIALDMSTVFGFKREAKITSNLRCSQIVSAFGFGIDEAAKAPYLVLDFVDGPNLKQVLQEHGRIPFEMLKVLCKEGPEVLSSLHENGIVHSDLKPSKFMFPTVVGNLTMRLIGFGRAKMFGGKPEDSQLEDSSNDQFCPLYSSPEQFLGQAVGPASDIYSFGCVLYEAAAGAPPFCGESALETASMHLTQQPLPPSEFAADSSLQPVDRIILKCLAKAPEERYASATELGKDLQAVPAFSNAVLISQSSSGGWKRLFGFK